MRAANGSQPAILVEATGGRYRRRNCVGRWGFWEQYGVHHPRDPAGRDREVSVVAIRDPEGQRLAGRQAPNHAEEGVRCVAGEDSRYTVESEIMMLGGFASGARRARGVRGVGARAVVLLLLAGPVVLLGAEGVRLLRTML